MHYIIIIYIFQHLLSKINWVVVLEILLILTISIKLEVEATIFRSYVDL